MHPLVEDLGRRAPQGHGVDRFHERGGSLGPLCEETVGLSVEQQNHRDRIESPRGGLEVQVECDGDPAHVADLEVEDHEIGAVFGDEVAHLLTRRDLEDVVTRSHEREANLVSDPGAVRSDEDRDLLRK